VLLILLVFLVWMIVVVVFGEHRFFLFILFGILLEGCSCFVVVVVVVVVVVSFTVNTVVLFDMIHSI